MATVVSVFAGLACVYLLFRPSGVGEALRALGLVVAAAPLRLVVSGLGLAILCHLLARWLELPTPRSNPRPKSADIGDVRGDEEPGSRKGERLRSRLEAALEGRRADVPLFVERLLAAAVLARASDIHLQPLELTTRVSLRVGGELSEVAAMPQAHHAEVIRRLKVLANLVPYEDRRPQDGRFTFTSPRGAADFRLSVVPTAHGEKAVLRLVQLGEGLLTLDRLGLDADQQERLQELLTEPQGVVLFTGPTGSGKTTSLYAALEQIHRRRGATVQIATLEDPVEIELSFVSQTQVNRSVGLGFAEALRSVLRQDPNVLMVGEIRDGESARIAVQAGLSGHLLLSSLHAESAVGGFPRLVDLGVEPFLVGSSVLAVVSQRLVQSLCPECRHPATPTRAERQRLQGLRVAVDGLTFQAAEGCVACNGTGSSGRRALFEILRTTPELRRKITARAPLDDLAEQARSEGTRPLLETAIAEAARGRISLAEALRVAAA